LSYQLKMTVIVRVVLNIHETFGDSGDQRRQNDIVCTGRLARAFRDGADQAPVTSYPTAIER
jgi:hypothetical protein